MHMKSVFAMSLQSIKVVEMHSSVQCVNLVNTGARMESASCGSGCVTARATARTEVTRRIAVSRGHVLLYISI